MFKYETHAHTAEISPCAKLQAFETVNEVKKSGFDCLIITDHYLPEFFSGYTEGEAYGKRLDEYFAGYDNARKAGEEAGLLVLPAMEVRLTAGPEDYLVFGIEKEELKKIGCLAFLTIEELSRKIRSTKHGLLIQAHPFRGYCICAEAAYLDGVEVVNGNPRHNSHNRQAMAFAKENGLLETAGTDVHQENDSGAAWMTGPACDSIEAFADLLRAGKITWACADECLTD